MTASPTHELLIIIITGFCVQEVEVADGIMIGLFNLPSLDEPGKTFLLLLPKCFKHGRMVDEVKFGKSEQLKI